MSYWNILYCSLASQGLIVSLPGAAAAEQSWPIGLEEAAGGSELPTDDREFFAMFSETGHTREMTLAPSYDPSMPWFPSNAFRENRGLFDIRGAYGSKSFGPAASYETDTSRNGYWNTRMKSEPVDGAPDVEMEFAVSSINLETGEGFEDLTNQRFRLTSQDTWQSVTYGATFQSVGKRFAPLGNSGQVNKSSSKKLKNDQQGFELWAHRRIKGTGIKPFLSSFRDNFSRDPDKPQVTTTLAGSKLDYAWLSWPHVGSSLTYSRGLRESSREPIGVAAFKDPVHIIAGSLYYGGRYWNGTLSSEHSASTRDWEAAPSQPVTTTYYAGASYAPSKTLSIAPDLTVTSEEYPQLSAWTRTVSTSLALGYRPRDTRVGFNGYAQYETQDNPEWGMDTRYLFAQAGIELPFRAAWPRENRLGLSVTYDRYRGKVASGADTGDVTLWVTLRNTSAAGLTPFTLFK